MNMAFTEFILSLRFVKIDGWCRLTKQQCFTLFWAGYMGGKDR